MSQIRRSPFWSVFLILLVLLGNTGVGLTSILCGCTGKQYTSFFAPAEECCEHAKAEQPKAEKKTCCAQHSQERCSILQASKGSENEQISKRCCSKNSGYWHTDAADTGSSTKASAKKCACTKCTNDFPPANGSIVGLFLPYTDTNWRVSSAHLVPLRQPLWVILALSCPLSRQIDSRHFAALPAFAQDRANWLQTYRC